MNPLPFVLAMCGAEILGMLSFAGFQALIPTFAAEWGLSNTDAGWISGVYFAGYVGAVPVLVSLTDRLDPRRVLVASLLIGGFASLGYALFAEGFWTALVFRALHGVGLAGTYMPGLKALSDHIDGPRQSRYVAFYTSSFGVGAALSYVIAGEVATLAGWEWAFAAAAAGTALAIAITLAVLPASRPGTDVPDTHLLDFRPVLSNRAAMGYILGYAGHNWELFAFRSWVVAFLVFAQALHPDGGIGLNATTIAAVATLLGVPASIFGNEFAVRLGRLRLIVVVMAASIALSLVLGFASSLSFPLVVALCLVYGVLLTGDSAAITAGTVAAAAPGQRGQTLAMHAAVGFMGGVFGPLAVGIVLDAAGGATAFGWGMAFIATGFGSVMALVAVVALRRRD
jgi:MFS family permease